MTVHWQSFYESLWQFIVTILIQTMASVLMLYLVFVMVRRFWCSVHWKKLSKLRLTLNNSSSRPISSVQSPVSSPKHHKQSSSQTEDEKSNLSVKSLKQSFKILTIVYLICFLIYALSSLIFRLSIVFLDVSIWCWIPDYMGLWFVFSRIALHCIYLTR